MPREKAAASEPADDMRNALARPGDQRTFQTLLDPDKLQDAVFEGSSTGKVVLENRRITLEEDSLRLDGLYERLRNPVDKDGKPEMLTGEDKQRIVLEMMSLFLCATVRGLGLVVDCLSIHASTKKDTKTGFKRISVANIMDAVADAVDSLTTHEEVRDKSGKIIEEASVGEIGGWIQFMDQRVQRRLEIIQGMAYIGANNVYPGIFSGPVLDDNGVPRLDPKTHQPMHADDLFAGDRATVSSAGGPKRRLSEVKAEREAAETEVVTEEEIAERRKKLQKKMEEDRERTRRG